MDYGAVDNVDVFITAVHMVPAAKFSCWILVMAISIIIPAHNEANSLGNLLLSIRRYLTIACEVIVVDNGSTDSTADVALQNGAIVVSQATAVYPSVARNIGAKRAGGEFLIFLDGDTRVTADWCSALKNSLQKLHDNPMVMTGARVVVPEPEAISWIERFWFGPLAEEPVNYLNGANIITTAAAWQKLNGMDETLATGEDYELSMRARKQGVQIHIDRGFKLIHDGYPKNIVNFYQRERWHGKGDAKNWGLIIKSKVALVSLLFIFLVGSVFLGVLIGMLPLFALTFPALIPFGCAINRFRRCGPATIIVNTFLFGIYLAARAITCVECRFFKAF